MPDVELRADYDHDGRLTGSQSEYDARTARPGALLVPNADAEKRALPDTVSAGPPVKLDYEQYTPSAADNEILRLTLRVANPAALTGRGLTISVPGIHGVRVRFYDDTGQILPVTGSQTPGDHSVPWSGAAEIPLLMETRAYPGSPYGYATLLNTAYDPSTDTEDQSAFSCSLLSVPTGGGSSVTLDSGNFTVPQIQFLDNGANAARLYVCDKDDTQAALADIRAALRSIPGVTLVTVPEDVAGGDTWLQDQFQPGIVRGAGSTWQQVIIHLPRMRTDAGRSQGTSNLAAFVTSHFPARDVGLMNDFWNRSLSFADANGAMQTIAVTDCIRLGALMAEVTLLANGAWQLAIELGGKEPPTVPPATWPETRQSLESILEEAVGILSGALDTTGALSAWNSRINGTVAALRARLQGVRTALPVKGDTFTLPTAGRTFDVGAQLADDLFQRLQQLQSSGNYGGNIESAPPTADSPLGWIVLGNGTVGPADHVDPDVQRLLHNQGQKIFTVDTTWLDVGHVDEVLTFVPDRNGSGQAFAALRAGPGIAMEIVRAAIDQYRSGLPIDDPHRNLGPYRPSSFLPRNTGRGNSPVTRLLRGKTWLQSSPAQVPGGQVPDIVEPPRIYQRLARWLDGDPKSPDPLAQLVNDHHYEPHQDVDRAYPADITVLELSRCECDEADTSVNDLLEQSMLTPMEQLVSDRFKGIRIFPLPVVFDRVGDVSEWSKDPSVLSTSAFTPDVVNMQIVNGHLLTPRPYGPRMLPYDATAVLQTVLADKDWGKSLGSRLNAAYYHKNQLDTTVVWVRRAGQTFFDSTTVMSLFGGLVTLKDVADQFKDGFPGVSLDEVGRRIRTGNQREFTPADELRDGWRRLVINEGTVDLFEAYTQLIVDSLGLTLHWVDSWFYHLHFGGIHCGTNVLRAPGKA